MIQLRDEAKCGDAGRIAVLMAHYRCEKFLAQAVESVLGQRGVALNLYFVDDGSATDEWAQALAPYRGDPRLLVFQTDRNVGLFRVLNWLCANTKEPLIAFQDADDYSDPDRLRLQLLELEQSQAGIVGTSFVRISEDGAKLSYDRMPEDASANFARGWYFSILHPTMIVRRSVFERLGGFDGRAHAIAADTDFQLRASLACGIRNVDRPLYYYRQRPGSMTTAPGMDGNSPARAAYAEAIYRAHRARRRKLLLADLLRLPWRETMNLRTHPNDVAFGVRKFPSGANTAAAAKPGFPC